MTGGGSTAGAGAIRFIRWHPYGLGIDSNAVSNCYNGAPGGCLTGSPTSRTVQNPQAGVWEVSVDARRNSDAFPAPAPFTLTASILGASVTPNPDVIPSATVGVPVATSYTLTNLFGAFTGRAAGSSLGSAFRATPSIANLAQQQYPVTVPAGSTSLRATIGSPSDPGADLDLFVFRCTTPTSCVVVGQSADGDSEESVTIANPAAGNYVVLVDGFSVPAGTTTYKYIDVYFQGSSLGSVSVTDANALRPAGSSWTVPGSVTATWSAGHRPGALRQRQRSDRHERPCRPGRGRRLERHPLAVRGMRRGRRTRGGLSMPTARCSRVRRAGTSRDCRGRRSPARPPSRSGRGVSGRRRGTGRLRSRGRLVESWPAARRGAA